MGDILQMKEESFKLQHGNVNDGNFMAALEELCQVNLTTKVAWNIGRIHRKCLEQIKILRPAFDKIMKKYMLKDEKGEFIFAKGKDGKPMQGHFQYDEKIENGKDLMQKESEEFMSIEFDTGSYKLTIEQLQTSDGSGINVSGALLATLAPIFQD